MKRECEVVRVSRWEGPGKFWGKEMNFTMMYWMKTFKTKCTVEEKKRIENYMWVFDGPCMNLFIITSGYFKCMKIII